MVCFKPIKVWQATHANLDTPPEIYYKSKKVKWTHDETRKEIEIPCGHCLGCRLDHANMWATRITLEAKQWKKCCFVTLTYNNPNLPLKDNQPTLIKKDLQDFLKRLRYYEKGVETWIHPFKEIEENPIRYFACGEYGPKGGRPHYHLAIFNWIPDDLEKYKQNKHGDWAFKSKKLQEIWGKGFVVVEELNFTTAAYIARYVQKKAGIEPRKREYTGNYVIEDKIDERTGEIFKHTKQEVKKIEYIQEPEFIVMSRGVGLGWTYWNDNKEKIKRNKGIWLKIKDKTKLKPIPRYFKKLWEKENYEEYYRFKYEVEKDSIVKKAEIISRISLPNGTTLENKWKFYLEQSEKTLKDKAKYLKRNEFI